MSMESVAALALHMAHRAHAGQVDKAGQPYIEHLARVAAAVNDDPEAEAVAWLHDVLEDQIAWCDAHAFEFVALPLNILEAVADLTRAADKSEAFYYWRIRHNPLALRVKLADIADNSDEARLAMLDPAVADRLRNKYAAARVALGVS
ncbi:phosphohydrolase [Luteimonas sp. XNQY3]|nr:phosphohydrolase [Luteimonas sp. XNQY3]MCD9005204.1 phosphohydrolase [Luteimonas sp. XNQY3]